MDGLRITLGVVTALFAVGFVLLAVWGSAFRSSFGASPLSAAVVLLPPAVLLLLLLSLVLPQVTWLMHTVAVVAGLLAAGCLLLLPKEPGTAFVGLAYLGAWFAYYSQALRAHAG